MATTLDKIITAAGKDQKHANDLCLKLNQAFTNIGTEKLIGVLKNAIKYCAIPEWAKEGFINYKGYTLEVDDDGYIGEIRIESKFLDETRNKQCYINAKIVSTVLIIRAGEYWDDMSIVSRIDDMEDLLGIKIFD